MDPAKLHFQGQLSNLQKWIGEDEHGGGESLRCESGKTDTSHIFLQLLPVTLRIEYRQLSHSQKAFVGSLFHPNL